MLRVLRCSSAGCRGVAWLTPDEPYLTARYPGTGTYRCERCRKRHHLTPKEFHEIPVATAAQVLRTKTGGRLVRDLTLGGALTDAQATDLVHAGLTLREVHSLTRPDSEP